MAPRKASRKILDPYLFTGRRLDAFSQLYNNRNRQYNPRYGRFITKDPISFGGGGNLWTYVQNNPLKFTDPLGLFQIRMSGGAWRKEGLTWKQLHRFFLEDYLPPSNPADLCSEKFFVIQWFNGKASYKDGSFPQVKLYGATADYTSNGVWKVDSRDPDPIYTILPKADGSMSWTDDVGVTIFYPSLLPLTYDLGFLTTVGKYDSEKRTLGGISQDLLTIGALNSNPVYYMNSNPPILINHYWGVQAEIKSLQTGPN